MSTKQTYLKLVCGETSDINVHYLDTKEVDGIQVSSVMTDPTLRNDLDALRTSYESTKNQLTNQYFELNQKLEREIDRSTSYDDRLNRLPTQLREDLSQEIEDRSREDSSINSKIGNLQELKTNSKTDLVSAINELYDLINNH